MSQKREKYVSCAAMVREGKTHYIRIHLTSCHAKPHPHVKILRENFTTGDFFHKMLVYRLITYNYGQGIHIISANKIQ